MLFFTLSFNSIPPFQHLGYLVLTNSYEMQCSRGSLPFRWGRGTRPFCYSRLPLLSPVRDDWNIAISLKLK